MVLDMAISHAEFRRTLQQAFGTSAVPSGDSGFRVDLPEGAVGIVLAPESVRRIASLWYPVTLVTLTFEGLPAPAAERFMARFHQYFQRGGG
ncbi:MAG TPA: hypothetical protein VLC55_04590 [Burkholderiales bacterium]|nr:hypothetical protein [Burkholderiales bacterium]